MKNIILAVIVLFLAIPAVGQEIPLPPTPGYYDSTYVKLDQEKNRRKEERKLARRMVNKRQIKFIHITLFVVGTLIIWREQRTD